MPPAATPSLTRRALTVLLVAGALLVGPATAASAQDPAATTVPPTSGLLVTGSTAPPTTAAAPASTTTSEAPAAEDEGGLLDLDANEKVWVIVGALVGVAILMMVLTVVYWRHTRPERSASPKVKKKQKQQKPAKPPKERKRRRQDSFREDEPPAEGPSSGPLDLDELLGAPDASRSVFGEPDEDVDPGR